MVGETGKKDVPIETGKKDVPIETGKKDVHWSRESLCFSLLVLKPFIVFDNAKRGCRAIKDDSSCKNPNALMNSGVALECCWNIFCQASIISIELF